MLSAGKVALWNGCDVQGRGDAQGGATPSPPLWLELLVVLLVQESKLRQPYASRNVPGDEFQLFAEAIPATDSQSGHFGSICRLALIDGGGVLSAFSLGAGLLIASASARQQH